MDLKNLSEKELAIVQRKLARAERDLEYRRVCQRRYNEKNAEEVKAYRRAYYLANKEKFSNPEKSRIKYAAKASVKHLCPCGSKFNGGSIPNHLKSQIHKRFVELNPDLEINFNNYIIED